MYYYCKNPKQRQRQNFGGIDSSMKKKPEWKKKNIYIYIWLDDCCCCLFVGIIGVELSGLHKNLHMYSCVSYILKREKQYIYIIKHMNITHRWGRHQTCQWDARATTTLNKWIKFRCFNFRTENNKKKMRRKLVEWLLNLLQSNTHQKPHNADFVYFLTVRLLRISASDFFFLTKLKEETRIQFK